MAGLETGNWTFELPRTGRLTGRREFIYISESFVGQGVAQPRQYMEEWYMPHNWTQMAVIPPKKYSFDLGRTLLYK